MTKKWIELVKDKGIKFSEKYSLVSALGDAMEIRTWGINGLPSDSVSTDNGILTTKSKFIVFIS